MVTKAFKSVKLRPLLLKWYDIHGRDLPWRTKGNIKPNPYHVWLSEVMLQQTTVATVTNYFYRFIHRWPTLNDLALASLDDILVAWQGLGYYSRARNLYKAAQHFQNLKGLPQSITDLKKLPGVGDYTAAALAAIIYGDEVVPVDGNVIRVLARVFALQQPLPLLKKAIFEKTRLLEKGERPGDFAQALMDLGAIICRSKNPMCEQCPLKVLCQAYAKGWQKKLPVPALKKPKPVRYGAVFLIQNEKREIRLRYRPPKGLLANMVELPGTGWEETAPLLPPYAQTWEEMPMKVRHSFTHFHLYLKVYKANSFPPFEEGFWVKQEDFHHYALPTLMKKVLKEIKGIF